MHVRTPALVAFPLFLLMDPLSARLSSAQTTNTGAAARPGDAKGEIRGRVVEAGNERAVGRGTVSIRRATDSSFAGGALVGVDGSFHVDGLVNGSYILRVRALGFEPFQRIGLQITDANLNVDVGKIPLKAVATQLSEQNVTGERLDVELSPERNVYVTKNMTASTGGTALELLRHIPAISVDGSNRVSLRGSENVVVQINGRASPLRGEQLGMFLAQLPAATVGRVEVATNPSAKSDPEGTAGIVNIVLSQEVQLDLGGSVTLAGGTTGMASLYGYVGREKGPLTLVVSASGYHDDRSLSGSTFRTNLMSTAPAFVESRTSGATRPTSHGVTLRSEYRLNTRSALSFDGFAYGGNTDRENGSQYTDFASGRVPLGAFDQFSEQGVKNVSQDYTLGFRRAGQGQAPLFTAALRYSDNSNSGDAELWSVLRDADEFTGPTLPTRQRDATESRFPSWTVQGDYTRALGPRTKLEAGAKGTKRHTDNALAAADLDSLSGQFVPNAARTNSFDYREDIGAVYAVLSQQVRRIQAQLGLRLEQAATQFVGSDLGQSADNSRSYRSAFPSATFAYSPTRTRQLRVSYSRRISRPNPYQLSPVERRDNLREVFRGNPNLRAEYTDALELGLQDARSWGSLQLTPYARRTAHAVRYIQSVDTGGVSLSTYDNVASVFMIGADLNATFRHGPLSVFGGGGVYRYSSDASNLLGNLSTQAVVWSGRANATWKLSPIAESQVFVTYRAPYATEGGKQRASVFVDASLRRRMWNNKGNVTLRVADPFNMVRVGYLSANSRAIEVTERRYGQRGVFLAITRNFGKPPKLRPRSQDGEQGPPQDGQVGAQ